MSEPCSIFIWETNRSSQTQLFKYDRLSNQIREDLSEEELPEGEQYFVDQDMLMERGCQGMLL